MTSFDSLRAWFAAAAENMPKPLFRELSPGVWSCVKCDRPVMEDDVTRPDWIIVECPICGARTEGPMFEGGGPEG